MEGGGGYAGLGVELVVTGHGEVQPLACIHPARGRGYVSCKCEGGHPPGLRPGLEKVNAARRLKFGVQGVRSREWGGNLHVDMFAFRVSMVFNHEPFPPLQFRACDISHQGRGDTPRRPAARAWVHSRYWKATRREIHGGWRHRGPHPHIGQLAHEPGAVQYRAGYQGEHIALVVEPAFSIWQIPLARRLCLLFRQPKVFQVLGALYRHAARTPSP